MDRIHPYRPRVSRETRLLLITALIATAALWVLARVRFPDSPPPQNPVQPLLTQLTPRPTFADLAAEIGALRPRIEPVLAAIPNGLFALRFRDDLALTWINPREELARQKPLTVIGQERASGLSIVRLDAGSTPQSLPLWAPQGTGPRYLLAAESSPAGLSLRPVYIASLAPADNPRWRGPVWRLPPNSGIAPATFLFTSDAAIAGLVVDHGDGAALVPAETVFAQAELLIDKPAGARGYVGLDVQSLSESLSRATGATNGLVITWVDPRGPAAGVLRVGDVIDSANGTAVPTTDHWDVQVSRLDAGQTLIVGVRTASGSHEVPLVASEAASTNPASLGLTLLAVPGVGAEVVRVDPGSVADRAGLRTGDVITRAGGSDAPSPALLRRAFASATDRALIVAFTRGTSRRVTALER